MAVQGGNNGNHVGVIDYKGHSYIFYNNQGLYNGGQYDRTVSVEEFSYEPNNLIPEITMTYTGAPQIGTLDPYQRVEAETIAYSLGVQTQPCSQGTQNLCSIEDGSIQVDCIGRVRYAGGLDRAEAWRLYRQACWQLDRSKYWRLADLEDCVYPSFRGDGCSKPLFDVQRAPWQPIQC